MAPRKLRTKAARAAEREKAQLARDEKAYAESLAKMQALVEEGRRPIREKNRIAAQKYRQKKRDRLMQEMREDIQKRCDVHIEINGEPPRQMEKSSHQLNRECIVSQTGIEASTNDTVEIEVSSSMSNDPANDIHTEELLTEIARLKNALDAYLKEKAVHSQDACDEGVQEDSWSSVRQSIFEEAVMGAASIDLPHCFCCQEKSVVRCLSCGTLCANCDKRIHHKSLLLHDRMDINGEYVPVNVFMCHNGTVSEKQNLGKWLPPVMNGDVCTCGGSFDSVDGNALLAVITMQGRFNMTVGALQCTSCGERKKPGPLAYIRIGFWPSTVHRMSTLISEEVLRHCSTLIKMSPRTSVSAYCRLLTEVSRHRPGNPIVRPDMFTQVLREFNYCQESIARCLEPSSLECPCCSNQQHAAHIDGNFKLYRLKGNSSNQRSSYYGDFFIVSDEEVRKVVSTVRGSDKRLDKRCGDTTWKAAQNALGGSRYKVDQTGLSIVTCRHMLAQRALNMYRGEIFAYAFVHQMGICATNKVDFICTDIACQYWPWSQQHKKHLPDGYSPKPFLSVMHAKAHVFNCQVAWGGRWQDGSGLTTGESTELVNSYLSKFGQRTKYMSSAGREECLTEAALFWNRQKISGLAKYLANQYRKAQSIKTNAAKGPLSAHSIDQIVAWKSMLERCASQESAGQNVIEEQMELLFASIERRKMHINRLADTSKERSRIHAAIRRESAKLKECMHSYNTEKGSNISLESFESGDLPWNNKLLPANVNLLTIRQIVEEHLQLQRSEEELCILRQEMRRYLTFYRQKLTEPSYESSGRPVSQYAPLPNGVQPAVAKALGRLELRRQSFIRRQLQQGATYFHAALTDDAITSCTDELAVTDDESSEDELDDNDCLVDDARFVEEECSI